LILEVAIFGALALWLLALLPAAVITIFKEQWLLFGLGWLTLGILWLVGAASLAPPDSIWARRFYDEQKLARAAEPLRHPRPWRNLALGAAGAAALIGVLGFFGARPSPILGMDGGSLESSVGNGGSFGFQTQPCRHMGGNAWSCGRWDEQFSGQVGYRVEVDGLGCWNATRVGPPGEGSHKRLSGCVTLADYVFG
jgi:hypothetical protein